MATRPSDDYDWNTDASNRVTPSAGQQTTGWTASQVPPSGYFNWWQNGIHQWIKYIKDGLFRVDTEDTYTPIIAGMDPSTDAYRSLVDHNGYRMGQVSDWVEDWRVSGAAEPPGWTFAAVGSGTRAAQAPDSAFPFRHMRLLTGTTNPSSAQETFLELFYHDVDRTTVFEWWIRTGASVDAGTSMDIKTGLQFFNGGAWDRSLHFQLNPDVNADIETLVIGSATHDQFDTNVTIAINTSYRLRVELVGADNHNATNNLVRFFINGVMVRQYENFTTPGADVVRPWHIIDNNASVNPYDFRVGHMRACWNHRGSPDAL